MSEHDRTVATDGPHDEGAHDDPDEGVVDEAPDTGTVDDVEATDPTTTPRRRWLLVAPWVLTVLAVAVAGVSTWQWQQLEAVERDREAVETAAGTFMLTLTTWDATAGMGATREELREAGTERFTGEVDELFGTTEDLAELAEMGARSEGEVRRLHVQELDDDRAVALAVVTQEIVTDVTEGEEVSARYAEVELLRRGGEWLIDDVELLVDVGQQQAEPLASQDQREEAP